VAATFPLVKSAFEVQRRRRLDPVAIVVLLGILVSGVGVWLGGSPRLLLIRESLFTGALGLACFGSLLLPRPLMFYFGRHFLASDDPARRREFDATWHRPGVPFVHRLITVVWGAAFVGEFGIRVVLIYTLPAAWVLVLSPIILGALTIGTFAWTFAYVRRVRRRAVSQSPDSSPQ
ncbi:MAG TPA: VC0807 family protein, partial [archaeon]|nr:VC0807 family protein [archaeon]